MDAWKYEQQPQQQPKNHDMKHVSSMSYFLATSTRAVGSARQLQQYRTARARVQNELGSRFEAAFKRSGWWGGEVGGAHSRRIRSSCRGRPSPLPSRRCRGCSSRPCSSSRRRNPSRRSSRRGRTPTGCSCLSVISCARSRSGQIEMADHCRGICKWQPRLGRGSVGRDARARCPAVRDQRSVRARAPWRRCRNVHLKSD